MKRGLDFEATPGFVEPAVRAEFPGLRLLWLTVAVNLGTRSPALERRLDAHADRYRGAGVVAMRTLPIPHAYRAFFRHVGLDPDVTRIPTEQAAVERLLQGAFASRDALRDALLLGLLETGVPVWALDGDRVAPGGLGIRMTAEAEALASGGALPAGRLVVADAAHIHAPLFGEVAAAHRPGPRTRRVALFAVGVDGVPSIHLEEALWVCVEALGPG
ncbi:MAG: hypothetical protein JO168_06090 [Solirubrobacterales bacterium]|nr:hypothetical protein [Solirubrobacterales bacterium]MBV9714175.1 hypothetical protein [Solirubrobacterales bacterium]